MRFNNWRLSARVQTVDLSLKIRDVGHNQFGPRHWAWVRAGPRPKSQMGNRFVTYRATIGTAEWKIARATNLFVNSQRSSMLPPPRVDHDEIDRGKRSLGVRQLANGDGDFLRCSVPCTRTGLIRICNHGARRRSTFSMSRMAAPLGEAQFQFAAEISATAVSAPAQIILGLELALEPLQILAWSRPTRALKNLDPQLVFLVPRKP